MPSFQNGDSGSDSTEQLQRDSYLRNIYTTMTIALYNLGVEHEFLNEYGPAIESFNRALFLNSEMLDKDPSLSNAINEGL